MKRFILLMMAVAAISFTGCSNDDDNSNSDNAKLVGKWEVQKEMVKNTADSEWKTSITYSSQEYIWVFTKTEYGLYGDGWGENWEDFMSIYKLNLDKMEIFLSLAYPKLKVYKLTETEFEVEEPTLDYYECKLIMRRIE